ncbi:Ribosomal protein S18 acetylase RimI [Paenibacillus catalpae]|uniref:Ribosomal protein S18 acetylase RimI n=1 Tax=Paenibacillus catalpae TaxID=1045775 RepID=A0A1I2EUX8_9BACL|nr:GNAT family N-acetyltransferase [Paenibacillus catalpae]SFE96655.1 Ribosomal protein S18 acetylase RimI [Paenibacillus catalpae]
MEVVKATKEDIREWLVLAAEVEELFGPMVDDPLFIQTLERNIDEGRAFCMRENSDITGSPLLGGVMISTKHAPNYKIGWLAVSERARSKGVATMLMKHVLGQFQVPAEVSVVTFGEDTPTGLPARKLYEKFGFVPVKETVPHGPEGGSRQLFRLLLS